MRLIRPITLKNTLRPLVFISIWVTLVLVSERKQELKAGENKAGKATGRSISE